MATFFICYDLAQKDEDYYEDLFKDLKSLGAKRVQESVWALKSDQRTSEIFDALKGNFPDDNDRLLVGNIDGWSSRHSMYNIKDI